MATDGLKTIRVLIADDHTIVRQGIHSLLEAEPDIHVVGEANDGREAVRLARELKPDVVVMDMAMPVVDGLEATRQIKRDLPQAQILALTMHESDEYFFRVLQAGALGYVLKRAATSDLIAAVHAVSRGEIFLYPDVAKKLVSDYIARAENKTEKDAHDAYASLTPREREILAFIAEGLSNREIADRLVLSLSTVQTHYAHLMEKLNLQSRAALIKYAIRKGLIELDEDRSLSGK